MSASLSFSSLFTYEGGDSSKRLPLRSLGGRCTHVHGLLELEVSGKVLPHMGFFGPDDVCFNTWIEELSRITRALADSQSAEYTFDEGEQGQPAFSFRRQGDLLLVSVVASALSGAAEDASSQNISCFWSAFQSAVSAFFASFRKTLLEQCPAVAEGWWSKHAAA